MINIEFKLPTPDGKTKFKPFVSIDFSLNVDNKIIDGFFMADLTFSIFVKNFLDFQIGNTDTLVLDFIDWGYRPQIIRAKNEYVFSLKREEVTYNEVISKQEIDKIRNEFVKLGHFLIELTNINAGDLDTYKTLLSSITETSLL